MILCCVYDNYKVLHNYDMFQKYTFLFQQTFYFARFWVVSEYDPSMLTSKNAYFSQMCNIHTHKLTFNVVTYF